MVGKNSHRMSGNGKRPIGVDLFAGAGGMSLGFEQAGFDVAAAVEYDPIHCATHEFNFPDCAAICRSVADIDGKYIREHSRIGDRPWTCFSGSAVPGLQHDRQAGARRPAQFARASLRPPGGRAEGVLFRLRERPRD